jgi:hypothetical protein
MHLALKRIRFHLFFDRIDLGTPLTHWMLHFKILMRFFVKRKLGSLRKHNDL